MKYLSFMLAVLTGAFSCVCAQATKSSAASQAWVENYVSNTIEKSVAQLIATAKTTKTNNTTAIQIGEGLFVMEDPSDAALRVVESSSPVTNGTLFVWNGAGQYINPAGMIQSTSTNLVYQGVSSTYENGVLVFAGHFNVDCVLIQPSVSYSVTNKVEAAQ